MAKYPIKTGEKYGFLIALDGPLIRQKRKFLCKNCGNICEKQVRHVYTGHTTSCGCIPRGGDKRMQIKVGRDIVTTQLRPCITCRKAVCYVEGEECKTCYERSLFDLAGIKPRSYGGITIQSKTLMGFGQVGIL